MEWLIKKGMPQRTAHHAVGAIVGQAMEAGVPLADLSLQAMQQHAAEIDESIYESLGTANAVAAFTSYGSTAPDQVRQQVTSWSERLK